MTLLQTDAKVNFGDAMMQQQEMQQTEGQPGRVEFDLADGEDEDPEDEEDAEVDEQEGP